MLALLSSCQILVAPYPNEKNDDINNINDDDGYTSVADLIMDCAPVLSSRDLSRAEVNGVNFELVFGSLMLLFLFLVLILLVSVPGPAFAGMGVDDTIPLALFITQALKVPVGFSAFLI